MKAGNFNSTQIGKALTVSPDRIRMFFSRLNVQTYTGPRVILNKSKLDGYVGTCVERIASELPQFGVRRVSKIYKQRYPEESYHPGPSQINRLLQKKGFKSGFKIRAPGLTDIQKQKRVEFARKWLLNREETLGNIIWSDETMVRSHPFTRRQRYRYNPGRGETPAIQSMEQGGKNSVMFWGCFSKYGAGPLVALKGNQDGAGYGVTIKDQIIPELFAAQHYYPGNWRFMQDNASIHTSKANKKLLEDAEVDVITWPAKSPDLNPIENVWAWIKEKLYTEYSVCQNAEEIEERVMEIWNTQLTPEMCNRFCGNYSRRLLAVIESKGECTKY